MREDAQYSERAHASLEDRRSKIRIAQTELHCSLGRVMDISSTGMRVTCRRVPKEKWVSVDLNTTVDPVPVQVEVVWARRLGFRKYEVGLQFMEPSSELDELVSCCSTLDGKSFYIPQS